MEILVDEKGYTFVDVITPEGKLWYRKMAEYLRKQRYEDPNTQGWLGDKTC